MWPDNETTRDFLGFKVHADLIRSVVTNPAMLPTTIGVFGDWGGGKTSIMRMLEQDLDPKHWPEGSGQNTDYKKIAVIYANSWLFEGYDDTKAALISSILLELSKHERFGPKVRDGVFKLLRSVNWMRVASLGMKYVAAPAIAACLTGGVSTIPVAIGAAIGISTTSNRQDKDNGEKKNEKGEKDSEDIFKESPFNDQELDVRTFRERFSKMLKDGGIEILVVLVDDLDRCTPERIIDNLEAIKLFLSVEQTAFVIGADRRIVEHAISTRYKDRTDGETSRLIKDYLEKLVQIPYSLPRLSATEIETYMTLLFCQHYLNENNLKKCLDSCEYIRSKSRYTGFGYANVRSALSDVTLESVFADALTLCSISAPLITEGLKGNPRQVKRFLNALLLRKELAKVAQLESIKDNVLVKLMILEYTYPELFSQLFIWQSQQNGFPKELRNMEEILSDTTKAEDKEEESIKKIDVKWSTKTIRKWVEMKPQLNDVDLRDYFWVARDRLEYTFTGVSMVPPIVRTVLDGLTSDLTPRQNSAIEMANKLDENELASLLSLIEQGILRQPSEKVGYNALELLISKARPMEQAAITLSAVLTKVPLEEVPPTVGMQLMTLYNSKPTLHSILEPAKNHLQQSKTKVGLAAKSSK